MTRTANGSCADLRGPLGRYYQLAMKRTRGPRQVQRKVTRSADLLGAPSESRNEAGGRTTGTPWKKAAEGAAAPPDEALQRWSVEREGNRIALRAMRPGVRGYDVDAAQRAWMKQNGSEPVPWSTGHPVGYWAHDMGPALGGAQRGAPASGESLRQLEPGQTFAFDGFFAWTLPEGGTKTISVEEMAVVTSSGAEYLIEPQESLILIGTKE